MPYTKYTMIILLALFVGCQYNSRPTAEALFYHTPSTLENYDLKKPDAKYFLPYVLEEISGMTYYQPGVIACIQDEDGKIFFYNHHKRELEKTIKFEGSGDYEGITCDGEKLYIVESNGDLHKIVLNDQGKIEKKKKYNTILKKSNDVEGLVYDPGTENLYLICKGDAGLGNKKTKGKAAYIFDLDKKEVKEKPAFKITKDDIKNFLEENKDFKYESNRINFNPSGIALHPTNGHFYIIASVGKLMLITDKKGNIKGSIPLDPRLLGQPEGICFAPNGDMFISSEGQGDKGYILKFNMN
ncbi:MAG: SdiA-regulated domain-containing protein [Reichenbachiella sp.]|uniref:SdiA-regulated domain-containing protein n=1 Tax=Reichenbachiella sp. TaxID=2184521 RepID=UPI00326470F7